jgi:hypothetical protein
LKKTQILHLVRSSLCLCQGTAFAFAKAQPLPLPRHGLCLCQGTAFPFAKARPFPLPRHGHCPCQGMAFAFANAWPLPLPRHGLCLCQGTAFAMIDNLVYSGWVSFFYFPLKHMAKFNIHGQIQQIQTSRCTSISFGGILNHSVLLEITKLKQDCLGTDNKVEGGCGSLNMPSIFSFFFHLIFLYFSYISLFLFFLLLAFSHPSTHKSADIIPDSESTDKITPSNTLQHHYHPTGSEAMDTSTYTLATYTKLHNSQISIYVLKNIFYGENHSRKLHTEFSLHVQIRRYSQYKFQHPVLHQLHDPTSNP